MVTRSEIKSWNPEITDELVDLIFENGMSVMFSEGMIGWLYENDPYIELSFDDDKWVCMNDPVMTDEQFQLLREEFEIVSAGEPTVDGTDQS
jgi:hypothetical protein